MTDTKVSRLKECFVKDKRFFHSLETAYLGDVPEQGLAMSKESRAVR